MERDARGVYGVEHENGRRMSGRDVAEMHTSSSANEETESSQG